MSLNCNDLQAELASRYDLRLPCQVQDYICHDAKLISEISGEQELGPEALLVRQVKGDLDVTLFLEKHLLESALHPSQSLLGSPHFDDYYTVLEGVSHFVYLIWNAQYGRQIKPVEMELQAEIDKFVFAALVERKYWQRNVKPISQRKANDHRELENAMFHNVRFLDHSDQEVELRYRTANDFASRYCSWLTARYRFTESNPGLYAELARFYRMGSHRKFDYINQLDAN